MWKAVSLASLFRCHIRPVTLAVTTGLLTWGSAAQLQFTPQGQGLFKLTNLSSSPREVELNVQGTEASAIRLLNLTNGVCDANLKSSRSAATLTLAPGDSRCIWVRESAGAAVPSTSKLWELIAQTRGSDSERISIRLDKGTEPSALPVPASPKTTLDDPAALRVATCENANEMTFLNERGESHKACVTETGQVLGLLTPLPPAGTYRNNTGFAVGGAPAVAELNIRRPSWWAAGLIALGLILPALFKYIADRRREKEQLRLALTEEGLHPGPNAHLLKVPSAQDPVLALNIPPGLLRPKLALDVTQPFSDVRAAYAALVDWRELTQNRQIYVRFKEAYAALPGTITDQSSLVRWQKSRLNRFLNGVLTGAYLGVPSTGLEKGPALVPMTRATEVVGTLESARNLTRTLQLLDLARLRTALTYRQAEDRVNFRLLERLVFEGAPASTRAEDIDAFTKQLVVLGDAVLIAVYGGAADPQLPSLAAGTDGISQGVGNQPGGQLLRANAAIRWFTLPLLLLALTVSVVVGLEQAWASNLSWGSRTWLDYLAMFGVGVAGFAGATLLQSVFKEGLSGSALVPGLLRKLGVTR